MTTGPSATALERLDTALYRAERGVVGVMLATMGLVVFLDVAHRVSTREGGFFASPVAVLLLVSTIATLALRTRGSPAALPKGLAAGVAFTGLQLGFVALLPNGLVWSQTFALALTLWLGTIGAALAAYERRHLALDVGSQVWPEALRPKVAAVGHLVTAAFCVLLLWLGWRSVEANWDLWVSTEHAAGNLSGLAIPKWAATLSIPYGMAVLALRFTLDAWRAWTGRLVDDDDTLKQLGIQVDDDAREAS